MSDEKDLKYLDPDQNPLESDEGPPLGADADKSPLDGPEPLPGMDPERDPFDGSPTLLALWRECFGENENVHVETYPIRKNGEKIEIEIEGTWKDVWDIDPEIRQEIRASLERFKLKHQG